MDFIEKENKISHNMIQEHQGSFPVTFQSAVVDITSVYTLGIDGIDKVIALGATAYLVKSQYSLEELVAKVKEVINP